MATATVGAVPIGRILAIRGMTATRPPAGDSSHIADMFDRTATSTGAGCSCRSPPDPHGASRGGRVAQFRCWCGAVAEWRSSRGARRPVTSPRVRAARLRRSPPLRDRLRRRPRRRGRRGARHRGRRRPCTQAFVHAGHVPGAAEPARRNRGDGRRASRRRTFRRDPRCSSRIAGGRTATARPGPPVRSPGSDTR